MAEPILYAIVKDGRPWVDELMHSALLKYIPSCTFIDSLNQLPTPNARVLQFADGENFSFEHVRSHPQSSLLNSYTCNSALTRKSHLSDTISQWTAKNPTSLLKTHFLPSVNFELVYAQCLDEALQEAFEIHHLFKQNENKDAEEREWWILKPSMLDGGMGIGLFSTMEELRWIFQDVYTDEDGGGDEEHDDEEYDYCGDEEYDDGDEEHDNGDDEEYDGGDDEEDDEQDDSSTGTQTGLPLGGVGKGRIVESRIPTSNIREFTAQPYIHPPLLLPGQQRKFHIRTYVVSSGWLQVYVYVGMAAIFAPKAYCSPGYSTDLGSHLTNTNLQGEKQRFWDLPSQGPEDGWKEKVFEQICRVTGDTFEAAARTKPSEFQMMPNTFELFGVDYMVDATGNVWLLEINAGPSFKPKGGDLDDLTRGLFEGLVEVAVCSFFFPTKKENQKSGKEDIQRAMLQVLDIDLRVR
jgi:tubulin---tyrosine ligase